MEPVKQSGIGGIHTITSSHVMLHVSRHKLQASALIPDPLKSLFKNFLYILQTYAIPLSSYEAMQAENLLVEGQQLEPLPIDHHHQITEKEHLSTTPVNKNKRKAPDTSKTKVSLERDCFNDARG